MTLIRLAGVTRAFREGETERVVLRGVDAEIRRGEVVALLGRSGSGKSTLLHLIGGIDLPTAMPCLLFVGEADRRRASVEECAKQIGADSTEEGPYDERGAAQMYPNGGPLDMRMSLAFGAWLDHEPAWLQPPEADAVLVALRDELPWEQREIVLFGRRILQPRLIAWAGDVGYRYSGQTLEPRPFTPAARGLLARACERTGVPFNHVLANRYRSGDDRMGLHADEEPELGEDPVVAIVSLGTSRRLVVRPRRKDVRQRHDLDLGHGSLLIMGGTCQRHYVHGVPRQPGLQSERISLTFRRLLRPPYAA